MKSTLNLSSQEAESMGVELEKKGLTMVSEEVRELPLHEQVIGSLTEDEVVEALAGEVSTESREDVVEAISDLQENAAEEEGT